MPETSENNKVLIVAAWIIVLVLAGLVLRAAKSVLFPFFLALMFYFVLSPVLDGLSRLKIPRAVSIIFIIAIFFLAFYLLGILVYSSGKSFATEFPKYGQKINSLTVTLRESVKLKGISWDKITSMDGLDLNKIGSFLLSSLGTFFSFLSNLFLVLIFLVFMLAGRGNLKIKIERSFNHARSSKINSIIDNIDRKIQKYLAIKTIICLISGVLATLILVIFGVNFAILFGFLTFLLNYIPNIGSLVATVLPPLVALVQFDNPWRAVWILVILIIFDAVAANALEPKLMGKGLGLSPLAVLFALFFWGWLWGIPGMILAVPIVAVLKIVCSNIPSLQFLAALMSK